MVKLATLWGSYVCKSDWWRQCATSHEPLCTWRSLIGNCSGPAGHLQVFLLHLELLCWCWHWTWCVCPGNCSSLQQEEGDPVVSFIEEAVRGWEAADQQWRWETIISDFQVSVVIVATLWRRGVKFHWWFLGWSRPSRPYLGGGGAKTALLVISLVSIYVSC